MAARAAGSDLGCARELRGHPLAVFAHEPFDDGVDRLPGGLRQLAQVWSDPLQLFVPVEDSVLAICGHLPIVARSALFAIPLLPKVNAENYRRPLR